MARLALSTPNISAKLIHDIAQRQENIGTAISIVNPNVDVFSNGIEVLFSTVVNVCGIRESNSMPSKTMSHKQVSTIPLILGTARLLAAPTRPNHLSELSSWGLIHLPPPCNSNDVGYRFVFFICITTLLLGHKFYSPFVEKQKGINHNNVAIFDHLQCQTQQTKAFYNT